MKRRMLLPSDVDSGSDAAAHSAALTAERRRLAEDSDALRMREANLREYEARIRSMQSEPAPSAPRSHNPFPPASAGNSVSPFGTDPGLDSAWQKLHRARAILEAEQANLKDDRLVMNAREADVKKREAAVLQREMAISQREEAAATEAAAPSAEAEAAAPAPAAPSRSAFARFTRAPFELASSVLKGK